MPSAPLLHALETKSIPPTDFTHAAHIHAAWLYLDQHDLLTALARFTATLRAYATHHGVATRVHATITGAFVLLIHERAQALPRGHTFAEFEAAHPELFSDGLALLGRYYRPETLASAEARAAFLVPDLDLSEETDRAAAAQPPGQTIVIPGGPSSQPKSAQGSSARHSQVAGSPQPAG